MTDAEKLALRTIPPALWMRICYPYVDLWWIEDRDTGDEDPASPITISSSFVVTVPIAHVAFTHHMEV